MNDFLRVGVITGTHGLRGEVKVFPTTDDPQRFKQLKHCHVIWRGQTIPLEISSVHFFKQFVLLKFENYDDINEVERFQKLDLLIDRKDAVPCSPGEYFICDLIGCDVVTDEGEHLGTLSDVMETGANNVYIVSDSNGKELLIPVIPQCILDHDMEKRQIRVHLLPGLRDL